MRGNLYQWGERGCTFSSSHHRLSCLCFLFTPTHLSIYPINSKNADRSIVKMYFSGQEFKAWQVDIVFLDISRGDTALKYLYTLKKPDSWAVDKPDNRPDLFFRHTYGIGTVIACMSIKYTEFDSVVESWIPGCLGAGLASDSGVRACVCHTPNN